MCFLTFVYGVFSFQVHVFEFICEILWLRLEENKAFEREIGVPRVSVGYPKNTRFLRPIQHQINT
jgi:hypothetical protein